MKSRLHQLRLLMTKKGLDAVLVSSNPNIIYLTEFNHFSKEEREAYILVTQHNAYIMTDKRYTHAVQTHIKDFTLLEIYYGHGFADWMKELTEKEQIKSLGIEEDNLTYREYKKIKPFIEKATHFDLSPLRIIKDATEFESLQKACAIGDMVFTHIISQLKPGVTENEVALMMEIFMKQHNTEPSFETMVAFDENAAFVHHKTRNKKLKKNSVVLMDFGVRYNNYCSDMSRTVFMGKATSEHKKAYMTVLEAQKLATEFIEKKLADGEEVHGAAADKVAREYIIQEGFDSFPHGLGHGVGLELHELPDLRPPSTSLLTSGMVFSNEPGIYVPQKFGIRIEDIYAIQGQKLIQLTKSSRELIEI